MRSSRGAVAVSNPPAVAAVSSGAFGRAVLSSPVYSERGGALRRLNQFTKFTKGAADRARRLTAFSQSKLDEGASGPSSPVYHAPHRHSPTLSRAPAPAAGLHSVSPGRLTSGSSRSTVSGPPSSVTGSGSSAVLHLTASPSGAGKLRSGLSTRSKAMAVAAGAAPYELISRPVMTDRAAPSFGATPSPVSSAWGASWGSEQVAIEAAPLLGGMGGLASHLTQQQQQQGQSGVAEGGREARGGPGGASWPYLVMLCAVSVIICYADRSNISTAVLPMAEHFNWDKSFQGVVLSTFFGGYALTQVLGGRLADQYGGKPVLAAGVALWSIFTALTPEAAAAGVAPILAVRVALGVGEGVAFPSIHSIISRNVPQARQSTAVGVVTAASYVGTALAFGISPTIITHMGWQWVFYLFAALALLWLPLWLPLRVSNLEQPSVAGLLKASGRAAMPSGGQAPDAEEAQGPMAKSLSEGATAAGTAAAAGGLSTGLGALADVSDSKHGFWAMMRRREVWAICVAQYCQSWGLYGLLNWLPTFFKDYYHVEMADLAAYTLAPYVAQGGLGLLSGIIADKMIAGGWGIRRTRILLQVLGMLGPAVCLMLAVSPAVGSSAELASSLITVGLGLSALTLGGVSVSHLDVAPRNAGVVFGAGNTMATIAGLLSVPFTGFLLQATGSWLLVFSITAAHFVVGSVLWVLWVGDRVLPEDADPALERITA